MNLWLHQLHLLLTNIHAIIKRIETPKAITIIESLLAKVRLQILITISIGSHGGINKHAFHTKITHIIIIVIGTIIDDIIIILHGIKHLVNRREATPGRRWLRMTFKSIGGKGGEGRFGSIIVVIRSAPNGGGGNIASTIGRWCNLHTGQGRGSIEFRGIVTVGPPVAIALAGVGGGSGGSGTGSSILLGQWLLLLFLPGKAPDSSSSVAGHGSSSSMMKRVGKEWQ